MKKGEPKIYILGASGFLGSACTKYFKLGGYNVVTDRVDVSNINALKKKFKSSKPDTVINFAGVRAYPTIDWCEDHKKETIQVNVAGSINAMLAALGVGAYPIQISSGCVYSGGPEHFFTEDDEPNFYGSFYSRMRIVLQNALAELPVLYARIRMPISSASHPRNLINKLASYREAISIPNSVTLIEDLWPALDKLITKRPVGILNLTNDGYVEHKDILDAYKRIVDSKHIYKPITIKRLEGPGGITKAKRSNCVLSVKKAKSFGISMPALDEAKLEELMKEYKKSIT